MNCTATSCEADGELCRDYYICPDAPKYITLTVTERLSTVQKCKAQTGNWYMAPIWFAGIALAAGYFMGHIGSAWQRGVWG